MIALPSIYKKTVHDLDRDRGCYQLRICPPGFAAVPSELTVEDRRYNQAINANLLLSGPKKIKDQAGKRKADSFTGLQATAYADIHTGNVRTKGRGDQVVHNFLMVRFTPDANTMSMLYFPGFRGPFPNQRIDFVREIIGRGLL